MIIRMNQGKSLLLGKRFAILVFLIGVALVTTETVTAGPARTGPVQPETGGPPALAIESPVYDCGEIWSGERLRHAFVLHNKGKGDLVIERISPDCGVFAVRFDRRISPGGKGDVVLEVDTNRLKGNILKQALVVSNDPERPNLELQFKGMVKESLTISPSDHVRFRAEKGEPESWQFRIRSPRKKDFQITRVESRHRTVAADYRLLPDQENSGAGHVYELKLTLTPDTPIGSIRDVVRVHTDIPGAPPAKIGLMGKVEGPIRYNPENLTFTPVIHEGQVSRTVDFYTREEKNFRIKDVITDNDELKWEMIPVEKTGGYAFVVIWTGRDVKKMLRGKIEVLTDNQEQARIEIPYTVFPSVKRKAGPGVRAGKRAVGPS